MSREKKRHLVRGLLAGAGAGLAASWAMNVFMAGPGAKLHEALETGEEQQQEREQEQRRQKRGEPKIDATMKAADALTATATGGQHLSLGGKQKGGPIVHYGFGALMGALYGGLAEYSATVRSGLGTGFGTALFAGADLVAVPALHLSRPLKEFPAKSLAPPFAAHLVYGVTTELLRRALRAAL
jgi:putative membrane protein